MGEPAWKLVAEKLPKHVQSRFVYASQKVVVRGLGMVKPAKQLEQLIEWLGVVYQALPELEEVMS